MSSSASFIKKENNGKFGEKKSSSVLSNNPCELDLTKVFIGTHKNLTKWNDLSMQT